jgi:nitrogen fixation protein FixH
MSSIRIFPQKFSGRHALFALFSFFGVMFVVNGIFLYYAVGTFNGFETRDAYREGLNYNERIASGEAQALSGWKPLVNYAVEGQKLIIEIRDRRGRGVAGLAISGEIRRPVTDNQDQSITLHEIAPARYAAPLKLSAGQWIISAEVSKPGVPGTTAFRFKQRFWVKEGS